MQAYSLVADDIMDSSITRRGQLCWYRQDGVGLRAINDVLVMEGAVFQIIRKRFRTEPFYVDLIDLLREVCHAHPFSMSPLTNTFRSCIEQKWDNFLTLLPLKKTMWISPSSLLPGLSSFSRLQHLFENSTHTSLDDPQTQYNRPLQDGTILLLSPRRSRAAPLRLPC